MRRFRNKRILATLILGAAAAAGTAATNAHAGTPPALPAKAGYAIGDYHVPELPAPWESRVSEIPSHITAASLEPPKPGKAPQTVTAPYVKNVVYRKVSGGMSLELAFAVTRLDKAVSLAEVRKRTEAAVAASAPKPAAKGKPVSKDGLPGSTVNRILPAATPDGTPAFETLRQGTNPFVKGRTNDPLYDMHTWRELSLTFVRGKGVYILSMLVHGHTDNAAAEAEANTAWHTLLDNLRPAVSK